VREFLSLIGLPKGTVLYAFVMGIPAEKALIAHLASNGAHNVKEISHVELLGFSGKVAWVQDDAGLHVQLPNRKPCKHALAFKVHDAI
jgi:alpha-L-fucosidase